MSGQRLNGRALTITGALLLTSALVAPAFGEIEEVVVTAQKRSEDIQTVPIAVTAYTSEDLKAHQIMKFSDLQFSTPNVTYAQGNFAGANFQIRGIGITAVGGGSESGVAINFNDVFLAAPPTDGASFYDLADVEVLRGPQSTLYGRGATGGVVNITPAKPALDSFGSTVDFTYGNYNWLEVKGDVNVPIITDELGVRFAEDFWRHSGFTENIADGFHQNDRDQYSLRGSIRWQPSNRTTMDFMVQVSKEDDARGRADKELCAPDPTGTLGCTPAAPQTGSLNLNATYLNILASKEGVAGVFGPALALQNVLALSTNPVFANPTAQAELFGFLGAITPKSASCPTCVGGGDVPQLLASLPTDPAHAVYTAFIQGTYNGFFNAGVGLGSALGLTDTSVPFVGPANSNPSNYRQVNDDFNPINKQEDTFLSYEWKQNLGSWLDAVLVAGADHNRYFNQQSYTNTFGPSLGAVNLATAEATFLGFLDSVGRSDLAAAYAPLFPQPCNFSSPPSSLGNCELPVSAFKGLGISSGQINHVSPNLSSYDQSDGTSTQESVELRFNSNFDGPFNFLLGGYYLQQNAKTDYYVASNSLDYSGILLGGITSALGGLPAGLIGPTYYHNIGRNIDLTSKSIYGEVYYDIVPDLLKLTLGGRYNEDDKSELARIGVLTGFIPLGTSNESAALDGLIPFTRQDGEVQSGTFNSTTGRVVLDYTPKLDFTDQTLIYASYARGYKAGGFNPGLQQGISDLPSTYGPESIDAFELGTKNTLLGGHVQANGDLWYYNYDGLQVSAIIDNTSINQNISAKLYGAEGEFIWLATDDLQFNLNVADTHSGVTNTSEVDERNPTGGDPRAILVKDNSLSASANQNCVIYDLNPNHATPQLPSGYTFIPSPSGPQLAEFVAPPGGAYALTGDKIAATAFGSCSTSPQLAAFLASQGYAESDPNVKGSSLTGVPVSLDGNALQQTPDFTLSAGVQYTFHFEGGYTFVPRVDYYWQSHMWGRIFHDKADYINSWDVMNAQAVLNAPDNRWYVGAYVKNVFNKTYVTGEYLTSSSSGLYTNAFLGDPRTYGVIAGVHF